MNRENRSDRCLFVYLWSGGGHGSGRLTLEMFLVVAQNIFKSSLVLKEA